MRSASTIVLLSLLGLGCEQTAGVPAPRLDADALAYLADDIEAGRAALEASLVDPRNGYSQRRLQRYTADDWGALPIGEPRVQPLMVGENTPEPLPSAWRTFGDEISAALGADDPSLEALVALGERAFHDWPVQVARGAHRVDPRAVGLWQTANRSGGLVWVELPDGPQPAMTCSTCHATPGDDGQLVPGRTHAAFDIGALLSATAGGPPRGRWGPGRVDVTTDGLHNPTVITDLRPIRLQTHLHRAGTLRNDPLALAVRIETLMITSIGEAWRPPRAVALGLALYLWSLGDGLPLPDADAPGASVFASHCSGCHRGEALGGGLVPLAVVDGESLVGLSPSRGTGFWRVPSLRGVGDRSPLLADASVSDLAELLDPARRGSAHRFGLGLTPEERTALVEWLSGR